MRRRRSTHGFDRSIDRSIDVDIHGFDRPLDRSIDRHPQARVYTMLGHSACTRRLSSFIVARAHAHGRIHRSSTRARARKVAGDTDTDTHTHTGCRRRRRPRRRDGCFCGRLDADRTDGRTRDGALEMDDPARAKSGVDGIPWLGARASD